VVGESRIEEPLRRMESAYEILSGGEPDEAVAALAHEIARFQYFAGHIDEATIWVERSLAVAESLWLPEVLSHALNTKCLLLRSSHPEEAMALLTWSLKVAEENDLTDPLIRALNNLGVQLAEFDRYDEALAMFGRQLELSRKLGMRQPELVSLASMMALQVDVGRWDEALEGAERLFPEVETAPRDVSELLKLTVIHVARGEVDRGREIIEALRPLAGSEEAQMRAAYDSYEGLQFLAEGNPEGALAAADRAIASLVVVGVTSDSSKWAFILGLSAANAIGDEDRLQALLARIQEIPPGLQTPMYRAQAARFQARLAASTGGGDAGLQFGSAVGIFRELDTPFALAIALFEFAQWHLADGRTAEAAPLLEEAREIFGRLRATPWLERIQRVALPLASTGAQAAS
jgi:tetratricopeptide (TPR) repeat protein